MNQSRTTTSSSKPMIVASCTAAVLLLFAGVGYRSLARQLNRATGQQPFAAGTLQSFPQNIGNWVGHDVTLEESIIQAADVDDYLNRVYTRKFDNQTVGFWIAFGIRARDLMPHRPEVCYPGAGWTLRHQDNATLEIGPSTELQARILEFAAGNLNANNLTVLNYYIVDDETCADVALLRSKAWRGQTAIRYMAQVQITCQLNPALGASPVDAVRDFAQESYPLIRNLLEKAVEIDDKTDLPTGS